MVATPRRPSSVLKRRAQTAQAGASTTVTTATSTTAAAAAATAAATAAVTVPKVLIGKTDGTATQPAPATASTAKKSQQPIVLAPQCVETVAEAHSTPVAQAVVGSQRRKSGRRGLHRAAQLSHQRQRQVLVASKAVFVPEPQAAVVGGGLKQFATDVISVMIAPILALGRAVKSTLQFGADVVCAPVRLMRQVNDLQVQLKATADQLQRESAALEVLRARVAHLPTVETPDPVVAISNFPAAEVPAVVTAAPAPKITRDVAVSPLQHMPLRGAPQVVPTGPVASATSTAAVQPGADDLAKFRKMLAVGVPEASVKQKMAASGFDPQLLHSTCATAPAPAASAPATSAAPATESKLALPEDAAFTKYRKMLAVGIPEANVRQKMVMDGLDPAQYVAGAAAQPAPGRPGISADMLNSVKLRKPAAQPAGSMPKAPPNTPSNGPFRVTEDLLRSVKLSRKRTPPAAKPAAAATPTTPAGQSGGGFRVTEDLLRSVQLKQRKHSPAHQSRQPTTGTPTAMNGQMVMTQDMLASVQLRRVTRSSVKRAQETLQETQTDENANPAGPSVLLKKAPVERSPGGTPVRKVHRSKQSHVRGSSDENASPMPVGSPSLQDAEHFRQALARKFAALSQLRSPGSPASATSIESPN